IPSPLPSAPWRRTMDSMTRQAAIAEAWRESAKVHSLPVLETKLYSPKWRPGLLSRPRLVERLLTSAEQRLTLISAPAGFGKTTLLAEWIARRPDGAPV